MVYSIIKLLPLATMIVWGLIASFQLLRRRYRTITEIAFLLGSIAWAGYAAFDFVIFHFPGTPENQAVALLLGRITMSFVTFAAFFLLLFTKVFLTKAYRRDVAFLAPLALALVLVWDGMLIGMEGGKPWNWSGVFDPGLFLVWLAYMVVFASLAIRNIYKAYRVVRESSQFLGWRMFGIFISLLVTLALGLSTNSIFTALEIELIPLFSSMLFVPGIITLYVLVPLTKERISTVMTRWKSRMYNIVAAYIIYENGTLIASKTSIQDRQVDDDIFGATLDAIQTFMRTSFPVLLGQWLRRIEHGSVKILIERGNRCYIALVIEGEDTDTLWVKMKEAVERFERTNELQLTDWDGAIDELDMVDETLDDFFRVEAVFA